MKDTTKFLLKSLCFSFTFFSFVFFTSCQKDKVNQSEYDHLQYKSVQDTSKELLSVDDLSSGDTDANLEDLGLLYGREEVEYYIELFDINFNYIFNEIEHIGVEQYLIKEGINPSVFDFVDYYFLNFSNVSIDDILIRNGKLFNLSERDSAFVKKIVAVSYLLLNDFEFSIPNGCTRAVILTLVTTISAIWVGNVVALAFWIARKGYSIYKIIDNCGLSFKYEEVKPRKVMKAKEELDMEAIKLLNDKNKLFLDSFNNGLLYKE